MTSDKLAKIEEIYHAVLEISPEKRAAFLKNIGDDDEVRREVESLLSFAGDSSSLIDTPPMDVAAEMLTKKKTRKIIGTKIRHYKILSQIGVGGMGEVFLAKDLKLERRVAIKFINTDLAQDKDRLRRFINEAKNASALNHPNIITVYEIGKTKNTPFIAAEFIDGKTLRKAISENSLTLDKMLDIALQVAAALNAAHSAGIFHRDIKPENIILREDGLVKVLDFGLAKLAENRRGDTETRRHGEKDEVDDSSIAASPRHSIPASHQTNSGLLMGTLAYMSPEQTSGKATDARSDLWSLGIVLFEMYQGKQPFNGETTHGIINSILKNKPPPLDKNAPVELSRIIEKSLEKEADNRYQSAQDFLHDLHNLKKTLQFIEETERANTPNSAKTIDQITSETEVPNTNSSAEYVFNKIKHRKFGAISALLFLLLISVAAVFYFNRSPILSDRDTVLVADFENLTDDSVFSGTLKQGLALQLAQSPFLRIVPEAEIKETLRLLGQSAEEKITPEIAREICLKQNVKVFIKGSFATLGNNYVVTLQVVNAQTGETILSEQNEAESKEQVLDTLHKTVFSLREKLGESLASIKKFDSQSEAATTSSLEALRAYSMAMEAYAKGGNKDEAVVSLFQLAIKLDPVFALAYRDLARHQFNIGRHAEAVASITKAFEFRENTSENERLSIEVLYYEFAALDLEKAVETAEFWKRTFPRYWQPYHVLADLYLESGQFEKAVENGREAVRLNPNFAAAYTNPAGALFRLNRFAEAKEMYRQAMANGLDHLAYHFYLFWIGYFEHDSTAIQQQIEWMQTHDYKHFAYQYESYLALLEGRQKQSLDFSRLARTEAEKYGEIELTAASLASNAVTTALYGDCRTAQQEGNEVLSISDNTNYLAEAGFALAMCGADRQAQKFIDKMVNRSPKDMLVNELYLPTIRAAVELHRNQPEKALELLRSTEQFNGRYLNFAPFLQGISLLQSGKYAEAAAVFKNIREHPGWFEQTPLVPLAQLREARALALTGNLIESRQEYMDFFTLWQNADADLPILIEAKKEYLLLKTGREL